MLEHVSVPVTDVERAKTFYTAALEPLGYALQRDYSPDVAGYMEGGHTSFWISKKDVVTPIHVALLAQNREAVHAFHAAALAHGGSDNGAPGRREGYGYAAFAFDPDGNNIEAVLFEEGDE